MSDPQQTQTEPLLRAPSQQAVYGGRSSTRAYKVAGFTLLACLLIAGQALTAYFVLSQRSDIRDLKEQSSKMKNEMGAGRPASVPMMMHMPMNIMPKLMDFDEEASTGATVGHGDPAQATLQSQCQLEANGLKPVKLPNFRPDCDEDGLYRQQQCWQGNCWCVARVSGKQIPRSLRNPGPAPCGVNTFRTGGLSRVMALPDMLQLRDE